MGKNVLIISSSPNKLGNSNLLCKEFEKGAIEANNSVETIFLRDKKIGYCVACQYCKRNGPVGECAIKDDMAEILEKMDKADVIVLATPTYFYGMTAQLKTVLDRTYANWMALSHKELYYIITCADDSNECIDKVIDGLNGWEICLEAPMRKGVIYGKGVGAPGEIKNKEIMQEAYEMGKGV
jgi:multimeric flavodoxin WrbA